MFGVSSLKKRMYDKSHAALLALGLGPKNLESLRLKKYQVPSFFSLSLEWPVGDLTKLKTWRIWVRIRAHIFLLINIGLSLIWRKVPTVSFEKKCWIGFFSSLCSSVAESIVWALSWLVQTKHFLFFRCCFGVFLFLWDSHGYRRWQRRRWQRRCSQRQQKQTHKKLGPEKSDSNIFVNSCVLF